MELLDRCEAARTTGVRMLCLRCRHASRQAWWGQPLPDGKCRCNHPATREARALIASVDEKGHPSARTKMGVIGDFRHPGFRWPWEFSPSRLVGCRGYE